MVNALLPSGLPTQSHQEGGARFFRRIGSAVRGAIALARGPRRGAAPQPSRNPPTPRDAAAPPAPNRSRAPRQPRAAAWVPPPAPSRSGRFARWFGFTRRRPAPFGRSPFPGNDCLPFTPGTHPDLTAEVCEFLNTPVENCDPNLVRLVLAVLAAQIGDSLAPELGMDAKALFSTLCDRLGAAMPDEAQPPDAPLAEEPTPAPATPRHAVPAAPPPAAPRPEAHMATPAEDPAIPAAARQTTPAAAATTGPIFRRGSLSHHSSPSRYRIRLPADLRRSRPRRNLPRVLHPLPVRRLYYAACAGPP